MYDTEQQTIGGGRRRSLIADEQGGFQKQRGCRDQVLLLVLVGQMEMLKKSRGIMMHSLTSFLQSLYR